MSDVIEQFGGHSQAAGVTIKKENIDIFEKKLNDYLSENYGIEVFSEDIEVDGIVTGKFGMSLAKELELLEPCGVENRRPIFALSVAEAYASPIKYGSPHVSFSPPRRNWKPILESMRNMNRCRSPTMQSHPGTGSGSAFVFCGNIFVIFASGSCGISRRSRATQSIPALPRR